MMTDPEELFTPNKALVVDDRHWDHWFWALPTGCPPPGKEQGWDFGPNAWEENPDDHPPRDLLENRHRANRGLSLAPNPAPHRLNYE